MPDGRPQQALTSVVRATLIPWGAMTFMMLSLLPAKAAAQTIIWTTVDSRQGAAVAAIGLLDQILAQNEHLRETPMVHRKLGLRPAVGEEVVVHPGEVIVARVRYEVAYMARPRADFINTRGVPVRADMLRTFLMLNNMYCTPGGAGHCYEDKDRNKTWDGAGQANGRWIDVPFEVIEIRKELPGDDRRELVLVAGVDSALEYHELVQGVLAVKSACALNDVGIYRCGGMSVKEVGREGEARRFRIE